MSPVLVLLLLPAVACASKAAEVLGDVSYSVVAEDIEDSVITIGLTPEQVRELMRREGPAVAMVAELGKQIGVTENALQTFFRVLEEEAVELTQLPTKLTEIANRHRKLVRRMAALEVENPKAAKRVGQARLAIEAGDYDMAATLLERAEELELAAIRALEELEREVRAKRDARKRAVAAVRAEKGELAMTLLRYLEAARHFEQAAGMVPESATGKRAEYLSRHADAFQKQGEEKGDNAALREAIKVYRTVLRATPRASLPLDWAITKTNLGDVLGILGERESGTARLEQSVAAYRAALEERTRERVPLQWATTQNNLGTALGMMGKRRGDRALLEQALEAVRNAHEVYQAAGYSRHDAYFSERLEALSEKIAALSR